MWFHCTQPFIVTRPSSYYESITVARDKLLLFWNIVYRYIDDILSLNNSKMSKLLISSIHVNLKLRIRQSNTAASYLDCYLYTDKGKCVTRLYDKREDFNFPIANFPCLRSNIPSGPAYGVYSSQLVHLVRYARACCKYQNCVDKRKLLTDKFLKGFSQNEACVNSFKVFWETPWPCCSFLNLFQIWWSQLSRSIVSFSNTGFSF